MSLFRQTAHHIRPNVRPFISSSTTAIRRAPTPNVSSSPCAGRRNFSIAGTVTATADAFSWVHVNAGVPWYVAIPLLAIGVNATLRFPLQFYVAGLREKRRELNPLVAAWSRRHASTVTMEQGRDVPERILRLRIASSIEKSKRRIYKNWGVQRWKGFAPLLSMFPFVTISEALRRKCGAPVGWISQSAGLDSATTTSMFDPSLVNGGCLWFTDLSAMDPYFGLPIICSGLLIWNTWGKMSKEHLQALISLQPSDPSKVVVLTRLQKLVGRTMLMIPIMPLLFVDLPSAIFLYWAFSFGLTGVNDAILKRYIPKSEVRLTAEPKSRHNTPFLRGPK